MNNKLKTFGIPLIVGVIVWLIAKSLVTGLIVFIVLGVIMHFMKGKGNTPPSNPMNPSNPM